MFSFLRSFLVPQTKISFDPISNSIEVPVVLTNGERSLQTNFTLDTGAAFSVITPGIVEHLGLKSSAQTVEVVTASGIEMASTVKIPELRVGRRSQKQAPCLVTQLPAEAGISGLLGLSYLRHYDIRLDFGRGVVVIG